MPTYTYKCGSCGFSDTYIRSIDHRDTPPLCRECESETSRIISYTGTVWAPTSGGHK